jgi:hypothetical protein
MYVPFFPTGVFHRNNYDILCCNFLICLHMFLGVLHKHLLYTFLDFSHWIFKDSIYSM